MSAIFTCTTCEVSHRVLKEHWPPMWTGSSTIPPNARQRVTNTAVKNAIIKKVTRCFVGRSWATVCSFSTADNLSRPEATQFLHLGPS
jgi:hypothetical protein